MAKTHKEKQDRTATSKSWIWLNLNLWYRYPWANVLVTIYGYSHAIILATGKKQFATSSFQHVFSASRCSQQPQFPSTDQGQPRLEPVVANELMQSVWLFPIYYYSPPLKPFNGPNQSTKEKNTYNSKRGSTPNGLSRTCFVFCFLKKITL